MGEIPNTEQTNYVKRDGAFVIVGSIIEHKDGRMWSHEIAIPNDRPLIDLPVEMERVKIITKYNTMLGLNSK